MEETIKEAFDLEQVYDEQVFPLMAKIIAICDEHKMPMFATFVCANDPDGDGDLLCTTNRMYEDRPIPKPVESLVSVVMPRRVPPLHIKTTKADGSVEMTVVLG